MFYGKILKGYLNPITSVSENFSLKVKFKNSLLLKYEIQETYQKYITRGILDKSVNSNMRGSINEFTSKYLNLAQDPKLLYQLNITKLLLLKTWRGRRLKSNLPIRGQKARSNANCIKRMKIIPTYLLKNLPKRKKFSRLLMLNILNVKDMETARALTRYRIKVDSFGNHKENAPKFRPKRKNKRKVLKFIDIT